MGVVYLARQVGLNRLVALKMILSGSYASAGELQRFRAEAEVIATLQHPNIISIYEVGEYEGRPFFSLEFCGGGSLDRQIDGTPWPPQVAAQLIETLARAIQVAHEAGIVHRDLKPANVLFTDSAGGKSSTSLTTSDQPQHLGNRIPKITDFGLAKRIDSPSGPTISGTIVGTPTYMAPEQAMGHVSKIGPSVDIYALGIILYELLIGRPPFLAATPIDTMMQVIQQEPFPPRRLNPSVPRDLDTICLKCLQKDPQRRYSSAAELAEDLRRFREGEPIRARPMSALARGWRWCKRNRAIASLLALMLFGLLATFVTVTWLWWQAVDARQQAQHSAQRAEENFRKARRVVNRFSDEVAKNPLLREPGLEPMRLSLLQELREFYDDFIAEWGDEPRLRADLGRALLVLAQVSAEVDSPKQAIAQAAQASNLFDQLRTEHPEDNDLLTHYVESTHFLGRLHRLEGRLQEALEYYGMAQRAAEVLAQRLPNDPRAQADLGRCYRGKAHVFSELNRSVEAEQMYRACLKVLEPWAKRSDASVELRRDLAATYTGLGSVIRGTPAMDQQTIDANRQAIALQSALVQEWPNVSQYRSDLGRSYDNLALTLWQLGRKTEALAAYTEARKHWETLTKQHPAVRTFPVAWATTLARLSELQAEEHQPEAEATAQEAIQALRIAQKAGAFEESGRWERMQRNPAIRRLMQRDDFPKGFPKNR